MRFIIAIFTLVLAYMQFNLWVGQGSLAEQVRLRQALNEQIQNNQLAEQNNFFLEKEVNALKTGTEAIEARARTDLGMIEYGETFYLLVDYKNLKNK